MEPLLWNSCRGICVDESLLWDFRCWVVVVESLFFVVLGMCVMEYLLWNLCCGIFVVE